MTQPPPTTPTRSGDPRAIVVTGVAGFIGSHTAKMLLDLGHRVIGIDAFTPYYDRIVKEHHLAAFQDHNRFELHERLLTPEGCELFDGAAAVIHLAAQPGVRDSWRDFDDYVDLNVRATKYVLDAALEHDVPRVVCASSSSVYGDAPTYPTSEAAPLEPRSPYGITKLAAERLAVAYGIERGLSTVSLRYFTVYGPGQRPDMAIQRLITAAHTGETFPMFGDGTQIRDFTFVHDVARANVLSALGDVAPGSVFNVCSEAPTTLNDVIAEVERVTGRGVQLERSAVALGDVRRTGGSADRIGEQFGWEPTTTLAEGIELQDEAVRSLLDAVDAP